MYIRTVFSLAAGAAVGIHLVCAGIGIDALKKGLVASASQAEGDQRELTVQQKELLRTQLDQKMGSFLPHYVLWGEASHCDLRQATFLSEPATLELLREKGVRQIFLEAPPAFQQQFDKIASGEKLEFDTTYAADSTCGEQIGEQQGKIYAALIKAAASLKIKVYASDVNNGLGTSILGVNAYAMLIEGRQIAKLNRNAGVAWAASGMHWLILNRVNDKSVARFVEEHSKSGVSLIYRGNGHVKTDMPNSLRELLPKPFTLSFSYPIGTDNYQQSQQMCLTGKAVNSEEGFPNRPVNLVIDLHDVTVRRCAA